MNAPNDSFASPPCSLHEAGDAYLGYFTRDEIVPRLGALRAAAHALTGARDARVRAAGAQWGARLTVHLVRLNAGSPPPRYLSEAAARAEMAGLLDTLIPKIRDDALHAELRSMRDALAALPG